MLASSARLRAATEIRHVIRSGRRARAGLLTLHYATLPSRVDQPCAAAFVVPKKVGTAVARNTVTRRLRHALRDRLLTLRPGSALVVRVAPGAAELSFAELAASLDDGLARVAR